MRKDGPLLALALTASVPVAHAWEEPGGLMERKTVSTGSTDLASTGFEAYARPAQETNDTTELALSAGAFLSAGNTRSVAATFAEQFRLRRGAHQLSVSSGVNYGRSARDTDSGMDTTVENYQAKLRYDYFFTRELALFFGTSARKDRFQGLALRVNFAPGAAYYFIDAPDHQLWTELGYNLQHDIRTDAVIREGADEGEPVENSETRHFGRLFVGYGNHLNKIVTFNSGLEYLPAISPFEDELTGRKNWRLSWTAAFTSKVSDEFSVATSVTIDYDNNPLPGVGRADATTAVNLVYTLL